MLPRIAIPQASSASREYVTKVMPSYHAAVRRAGGEPVEIALDWENHQIARTAATCDAVLLPGSRADVNPEKYGAPRDPHTAPGDPLRDNADELLLQDAYNMRKPVFGICFGLQSLNVWRSGTLRQHLSSPVPHSGNAHVSAPLHSVVIDGDTKLAAIIRPAMNTAGPAGVSRAEIDASGRPRLLIMVNSSHHQAALQPGDALKPVAWCPDDQVVEAMEGASPDHWVLAVQWHPERMPEDPVAQALFAALIAAAEQHRRYPRAPGQPAH